MRIAIVNVNLEYKFPDGTSDEHIHNFIENVELPEAYMEDSFNFVKIKEE